jgi:hypothetical protein
MAKQSVQLKKSTVEECTVLKTLKGWSHEILVPFLIYLDRYEVQNRAGSGLFFILKRSSYLNFKKVGIVSIQ